MGFILHNNTHDCTLITNLFITPNDKGAKDLTVMNQRLRMYGFSNTNPTFCIKDEASLNKIANFIRIKFDLPDVPVDTSKSALQVDNVSDKIESLIETRLLRYEVQEEEEYPSFSTNKNIMTQI